MYTAASPPGSGFFSIYLIGSASARRFELLLVARDSHTRSPTRFSFTQTSAVTFFPSSLLKLQHVTSCR